LQSLPAGRQGGLRGIGFPALLFLPLFRKDAEAKTQKNSIIAFFEFAVILKFYN
jgi:hypothetical protein